MSTRRFLRRVTAAVVATAGALALASCGSTEPRSLLDDIENGHVTLGTKFDQPGLGERTPDKDFVGLDTDVSRYVVNYIADKNGWNEPDITWRETPSAQRETLINNGEVNMIAATYSINAGRYKAVDFGGPYLVTHQALLVRGDAGISSLQDIADGTRLCSVSGSTPAQKVKEALPKVQLQEFDTYAACAEGVKQGVVDALTTDATILAGFAERYKERYGDDFKVVELKNEDGSYWTDENYGIGLPKGDGADRDAVNEALTEMWESGEFRKIIDEYLGEDFDPGDMPDIGDLSFLDES
ncbi:glutamate ABC transporter substrate-binding protein [Corynebacterium variabile]|uniref:Glutamate-binding protein n=4 Tax=Corynebacterium variabile TaxID=1727 RepID=A0A4Y4C248_9CORY|nr:glutamate ABC transporter substrate-binding protein [Corynebacterium variabile]AEK36967.1 glutamate ABC transport system substrate-binding protein [Corynebacterium variabile DSM 44702]MDN6476910.1 glutamate ABC transporter substrate-binding protein [Corynebacterium variabile]MDN6675374.1 glutamate ABC transporter substrate-binding protein [Corynebacterium variabile]GEC86186.1 glutamate-binding protein [Corynebacterium variabile]